MARFLENIPVVTRNLLILNVIMYVATLVNENFMLGTFAMFYPTSPYFHWWQPLTHMFMHDGFFHIFFNMYTLVMFGMVVERALGTKKFLWFYFITGLGAVALHTLIQWVELTYLGGDQIAAMRTPMVGASGAIYGVLVAFAMIYPQARMTLLFPPVTLDAKWMVIIFIGLELVTGIGSLNGLASLQIAHFAHLGGALFGWLLILYWRKTRKIYC